MSEFYTNYITTRLLTHTLRMCLYNNCSYLEFFNFLPLSLIIKCNLNQGYTYF